MRKKWLLFLVLGMLLGVQAALAEDWEIRTIDTADRIQLCALPGLKADITGQNSSFTLTVDKEQTNWAQVITFGATSDDMGLLYNIEQPTGAVTKLLVYGGDTYITEAQLLADLKNMADDYENDETAWHWPAAGSENGDFTLNYRHYVEAKKLLTFYEPYTMKAVVLWYDSNRKPMYAEKMDLRLNFTAPGSVNVEPITIPAEWVQEPSGEQEGIERKVENGKVTYWVDKDKAQKVGFTNIQTIIQVPDGTVQVKAADEFGNPPFGESWFDYNSGDSTFTIKIPHKRGENVFGGTSSVRASYQFLDKDGNLLEGSGKMDIYRICTNDSKICLNYLKDETWLSIPADRFTCYTDQDGGKLKISYQDGLAHIQTAQTGNVSEADARLLPGAQKHYVVEPLSGDASYQFTCFGTPDAFSEFWAENNQKLLKMALDDEEIIPITAGSSIELTLNGSSDVFWQISKSQNQADIYTVTAETLMGRATLCAIRWYDAAGNVLRTEWFAENAEEIVLLPNTYAYEDPDQIPGQLDGPAVIDGNGRGWKLHAEYRPQAGSRSYVIDLELRDKEGNPVKNFDEVAGKDGIEFFLPYPQGLRFGMPVLYTITHYFDVNLLNCEAVAEMTAEENGIRFRVKSLSPIELSWKSKQEPTPTPTAPAPTTPGPTPTAQPGNPPRTGDSAPTAWWLGLCLLCMATAALMILKTRKS